MHNIQVQKFSKEGYSVKKTELDIRNLIPALLIGQKEYLRFLKSP